MMTKIQKSAAILIMLLWISLIPALTWAENSVSTTVRVIHASQGKNHIDPDLRDLAEELSSVFKYTSYRLLNTKNMVLGSNQKGVVKLPGKRTLIITPIQINKKRIKYKIHILKAGEQIFSTQILLKNRRSITIGGPRLQKGYLLFNISGSV